jgi:hypothetical protein
MASGGPAASTIDRSDSDLSRPPLLFDEMHKQITTAEGWNRRRGRVLDSWCRFLGEIPVADKSPVHSVLEEDGPDVVRQLIRYETGPGLGLRAQGLTPKPYLVIPMAPGSSPGRRVSPTSTGVPRPPMVMVAFRSDPLGSLMVPYQYAYVAHNSNGEPAGLFLTLDNRFVGANRYTAEGLIGAYARIVGGDSVWYHVEAGVPAHSLMDQEGAPTSRRSRS